MKLKLEAILAAALALVMLPVTVTHDDAADAQPSKVSVVPANQPPAQVSAVQQTKLQLKPVETVAQQWLTRPELQHSLVGLEIMHVPTGTVMFSNNGRRRFTPASISKIFVTSCALDYFGGDYKYHTRVVATGPVKSARLHGNLVIIPSQDPSLRYEDLKAMMASVAASGIKFIDGRVIIAPIAGGGDRFAGEWLVQDWGQDWMPVSSDFVVDRNTVSGRDPGMGHTVLPVGAESEPNAMTRTLLQSPWAPAWVSFNKATNSVHFYRPASPTFGALVVANPTDYNAEMARALLRQHGVKVDGHDYPFELNGNVVAEHYSKPLSKLLQFTLKESDNLFSQQLLRTIGSMPVVNKNLEKATLEERGLARMSKWLESIGAPPSEVVMWDGCGLSRKDCLTPHALNMVLKHVAGPAGNGPYVDLLVHRDDGDFGTFRYKTGAMDSVRAIAGIVRTSYGEPLAVSAIINAHTPSVRELRPSLTGLIQRLEALGPLTFPPPEKPKPSVKPNKPAPRNSKNSATKRRVPRHTQRRH